MPFVKRPAAALICSIICLSFSCCSDKAPSEQEYSPPPDFQPLNEIVEGRKNIYLIVKNLNSSYRSVMIDGAKDGGDDFGCNVYYSGTYAETEWHIASTMLQRQYYMSYTGIETALKLINGEKTPVKFVDSGVVAVNKDTIDQSEVQEALLHN